MIEHAIVALIVIVAGWVVIWHLLPAGWRRALVRRLRVAPAYRHTLGSDCGHCGGRERCGAIQRTDRLRRT
jgi:hypothetical protein